MVQGLVFTIKFLSLFWMKKNISYVNKKWLI
jgi:hypothetical protein